MGQQSLLGLFSPPKRSTAHAAQHAGLPCYCLFLIWANSSPAHSLLQPVYTRTGVSLASTEEIECIVREELGTHSQL